MKEDLESLNGIGIAGGSFMSSFVQVAALDHLFHLSMLSWVEYLNLHGRWRPCYPSVKYFVVVFAWYQIDQNVEKSSGDFLFDFFLFLASHHHRNCASYACCLRGCARLSVGRIMLLKQWLFLSEIFMKYLVSAFRASCWPMHKQSLLTVNGYDGKLFGVIESVLAK